MVMSRISLVSIIFIFFLTACSNNGAHPGRSILQPRDGLVTEPVFNGKVYLHMRGNPEGPVVFLVHGLGDDASAIWKETIKKLERDYFVATLDLPGFGQSSKSNELYSPENYVKVLHHLSRTYIGQPFHLVGHSMGGAISLRYAATYPNEIETLTLVDAAGILHRLAYTKYLAPMGLKMFSGMDIFDDNDISSLVGLILNKAEDMMRFDPSRLLQTPILRAKVLRGNPIIISGLALVLDDFSNMPAKVTAPTQIIWGEKDEVAPLRTGHVLNALIPKSSLHIIPGAGHVPIRKNPDEFHALLIKGLTQAQPDSSSANKPEQQGAVSCHNKYNVTYTGYIKSLTIKSCKNVLVKDATIGRVLIEDSRVHLENIRINAPGKTAIEVLDSAVMMTAGTITGKVAMAVKNSRLDIAGSRFVGENSAIEALSKTEVIFSLTPISSGSQNSSMLHGRMKLQAGQKL
jgi:pimeloyl-ACP methyl ester carboxylesterase